MPTAPTPIAPSDGATVGASTVELEWTPVDGATRYRLQLARDPEFEQVFFEGRVGDTPSFRYTGLPDEDVTLHWRVQAELHGAWEESGPPASFQLRRASAGLSTTSSRAADLPEGPAQQHREERSGPLLMIAAVGATILLLVGLFVLADLTLLSPGSGETDAASAAPPPQEDVSLQDYSVGDDGVYRIPIDSAMKQVVRDRGGTWSPDSLPARR